MLRFVSKQHTAFLSATLVMFIICLCLVTGGKTSESCAHIRLSHVSKKKLFVVAEEHSSFSLPFSLDTSNCPENNDQHFHIYVARPALRGEICVVGVTQEGCTSTNKDVCHCMEEDGYRGAVFTKILTMEDSGTWVWRIGGGERKEVEFMIRRSSKPHNVTVVPDDERTNTSTYDEHSDAKEDDGCEFSFPSVSSNSSVIIEEYATLSLPFTVHTHGCQGGLNQNYSVEVQQPAAHTSNETYCIVHFKQGECSSAQGQMCQCTQNVSGAPRAIFMKTVTRTDSGLWAWLVPDLGLQAELDFDIHYLPRITDLSVIPKDVENFTETIVTVRNNTLLQITCLWENGHPTSPPQSLVQLLDVRGLPFENVSRNNGEIQAEFVAECADNGDITCFVPGANENKTVGLIVKCAVEDVTAPYNQLPELIVLESPVSTIVITSIAVIIVIAVMVVIALVVVWVTRRNRPLGSRGRSGTLPPPPAPHTVRRRTTDSVVFRHGQCSLPLGRDSLGSVLTHIYSEIPDVSDERHLSQISSWSSVSMTSGKQYLHRIACPSTSSSVSESYAVAYGCQEVDGSTAKGVAQATVHPAPNDDGANDYLHPVASQSEAAAASKAVPDTEGPDDCDYGSTDPSFLGDYLHPIASPTEAADIPDLTDTDNSPVKKQPKGVADDYLHPVAYPLESEAGSAKAGNLKCLDKTDPEKDCRQISADYLHPIASPREAVTLHKAAANPSTR